MKQLKIAIVGMGLVGSYLINQLTRQGHKVIGYERYTEENYESVCAWAASRHTIKGFAEKCGLCFEDYILHQGKKFQVEYGHSMVTYNVTGLVTFDKHRMANDMRKGHDIAYGQLVREADIDCDMIIDATGVNRALLPRLTSDLLVPVVLYRVRFDAPPYDDFYLRLSETNSGYFWYFPLGNDEANIGAGDYFRHHIRYLREFLERFEPMVTKKLGRSVRVNPPSRCEPFYQGKTVGVGESIGTVFPLTGEGMIPSLQCADLFLQNMHDLENYRREVLRHFQILDDAGALLRSMLSGNYRVPDDILRLSRIGSEFYLNPERYGISVNPAGLRLMLNDLPSLMGFRNWNVG